MNEIQKKISRYLLASAGTANYPTDHTFLCFVGMIETGEASLNDFEEVGGKWLSQQVLKRHLAMNAEARRTKQSAKNADAKDAAD